MTFLLGLFLIAILTLVLSASQTENATSLPESVLIPVRVDDREQYFSRLN